MAGIEEKLCSEIESTLISLLKGGFQLFSNTVRANFLDNLSNVLPAYIKYVGEVKTIESQNNQLLTDIYFPLKIQGQQRNYSWEAESIDDLIDYSKNNFNLIEATAGHGKSFLLRYICCKEMIRGRYFPIFITLNRISPSINLIDYILDELNTLGFNMSGDLFKSYLKKNRFAFFFDGFDEIPTEQQKTIYDEIEKIARKNNKTPVTVTSRPGLSISRSGLIYLFKIVPLTPHDQIEFLMKMADEDKRKSHLIEHFSRKKELHTITQTPLLLTLLWIAYKYEQIIPSSAIEFYELLLPTFLYKHDNMKLGFNREKKAQIRKSEFKSIIEAFAFLAFSKGIYNPTSMMFSELLDESLSLVRVDLTFESVDDLKSDIVEVTCLIIKDGYDRFKFIHLTVLEYFTACFISKLEDTKIVELFTQLQTFKAQKNSEFNKWTMVLEFLSEIRTDLYIENYYLPAINKILENGFTYNKKDLLNLFQNEHGENIKAKFNFQGKLIAIDIPKGKLVGLPSELEKHLYSSLFIYFEKIDISNIETFIVKHYPDNTIRMVDITTVLDEYSVDSWRNFIEYFNNGFMTILREKHIYCENQINIKKQKSIVDIFPMSKG
ncbi:NACHT domain-containing protein [Psychroserpens sp.]|jgi:hypothetical protein|uniref:NACHT domain-containing protein n=1 Tax=Psychroserpens sp. TaxID=2020870 RepID=UPI0039E2A4EA